ncbi:transposase [Parasphingorhabdus sp.]|uniref:transposase n=1 Tax=Parasphingorhabdus sp. TaxID=2709688 RepID=UPI003FA781B7
MIQGFLLEAGLSRGDLSEADWRVLKGLLPIDAANRGRGRRPEENHSIINGILWRLRCGTPWRDVPPKYGNWNTIYRRFRRWSEAGVWEAVSVTRPVAGSAVDYAPAGARHPGRNLITSWRLR